LKTAGIICEYNPIHQGHVRHIAQTRALIGEDCAVACVLSGNFVQRGDFAVLKSMRGPRPPLRAGQTLS
jgi:predicted nucleotidyltransferase